MTKLVYGQRRRAEGNAEMKDLLGGKGANLAEMTRLGHPGAAGLHHLDPRLQRTTSSAATACRPTLRAAGRRARWRSSSAARASASATRRIRCSSRCAPGAKFSMPGMMDTILNLGLNDRSRRGLARAQRRRALRLRLLPPLHPDVRRRSCSASTSEPLRARCSSAQATGAASSATRS